VPLQNSFKTVNFILYFGLKKCSDYDIIYSILPVPFRALRSCFILISHYLCSIPKQINTFWNWFTAYINGL